MSLSPPQQQDLLDPASAGALWRASRLEAFRDRAVGAGLLLATKSPHDETAAADDDGKTAASKEIASLLGRAAELSRELDALASAQATGEVQAPWWADGEYDDAAADAANDRGVEALRRWKKEKRKEEEKKKSNASSSSASSASSLFFAEQAVLLFTEAVRLRPSSAVYSANRSRAALASGRAETALAAADEAATGNPSLSTAWSLRGRALSSMGRFGDAVASFERALELEEGEGGKGAEAKAAATTRRLLEAARASEAAAEEAAAACNGARPALPREETAARSGFQQLQQDAGDALEAAERALRAEPGRHELLRAKAEVRKGKNSTSCFSSQPFWRGGGCSY